ncbi:peptidase S8/S53 domain-containing protein [Thamnidium elegans]|nr:peptidase S8/S53 domain-containing protein [Thamnidium elegans]
MAYNRYLLLLLLLTLFNSTLGQYIIEFTSAKETNLFLTNYKHVITKIRHLYDSDVLTGTAIDFQNEKVAKQIIDDDQSIVHVWPIHHRIRQQAPIIDFKNNESNSNSVPFVPQNKDTLRILTQENNKSQTLKSNGKGIKIGIIDSGVDYTLPALGGCFGKNCKIAYGHDLVGNDFDGTASSIKESNDPIDNCPANSTSATGHGTFVTGIIAAEDKQYNWNGVAPGATIGMWKVYGCNYPAAPNDIVIKAMEMAYKAKMDVISISLGVSGGWAEDILSVVADRIVSKGVHVITASGNIGTRGIFLTASPASAKNVIAAGSTMNRHVPGYILKLYNESKQSIEIAYRTFTNTPLVLNKTLPLKSNKKFNAQDDACKKLDEDRYNGSIALIHQTNCDPLLQIMHARDAGAKAVLMYTDTTNNATTQVTVLSRAVLPVAFINHDDAKKAFESSKVEFTNILVSMTAPASTLDTVSAFSTLGPTNELDLKPELLAIGGDVFSTLPRYLQSYGFRSGTSFSTPYIAGSVALLLSNTQTNLKPDQAKNILMNFANQVTGPISDIHYGDSPIRQGAGVIDVTRSIAAYNNLMVLPAKLSFNDTSHFNKQQHITIYNQAKTETTFEISHSPSLTVTGYSLTNTTNKTPLEPIGLFGQNDSVATMDFSCDKLVVPAGESAQVRVRIQPPPIFEKDSNAMYGGYIGIRSNEYQATVPYFGMIGNMHDLPILDKSSNPSPAAPYTFPAIGYANSSGTLNSNETGHFHIQHKESKVVGAPYVLVRILTGTRLLMIQVLNKRGKIVGDVPIDESRTYMMRNTLLPSDYSTSFYSWNWNGDYVPKDVTLSGTNKGFTPKLFKSGEYRLKVKGLRVNGNPANNKDWDEWISPRLKLVIE